eukprot:10366840-Alexandrium_andersonii.AAC.1
MSASLVGSEMCIRDRVAPTCSVGRSVWGSSGPTLSSVPACRAMPVAVSYTHLTLPTICSV